jgi:hypothetical protein
MGRWCCELLFFGLSVFLLRAYGLLHWGIISKHYRTLDEPLKGKLFDLLGMLEVYHFTALLAIVFGLRTFWTHPRWMRWVWLPMIIGSLIIVCNDFVTSKQGQLWADSTH